MELKCASLMYVGQMGVICLRTGMVAVPVLLLVCNGRILGALAMGKFKCVTEENNPLLMQF